MMERKEIFWNLLIILFVFVLAMIPWASVFGIQDPGLLEAAGMMQRGAAAIIILSLVIRMIRYADLNRLIDLGDSKPLTKEMEEEEIKEAEQKDGKQLLFKPTIGVSVMFTFFIALPLILIISQFIDNNIDSFLTITGIGMIAFFTWGWHVTPVFIFAEDSVQIKSHLFYLLGIVRKDLIRYADITLVSPDPKIEANAWGEPKHSIVISMNGTTKKYVLTLYNSEIIAKIYLRFKEKLGDKVKITNNSLFSTPL
jgi:hypothetical protein